MAQALNMMMPWSCIWITGRASAKTTQVMAERVQQAVVECQGAPFLWLSDTYSDLHKNIIPSLLEGLRFLGWYEGVHFVIDKEPTQSWRNKMYNVNTSFKGTMTFFTGFTFTFVSLDRPAIGAGRSYVGIFGDEIKYWPEDKFTNALKSVRGYRAFFGENPWYRSRTFFSDMYNPNHIGEYGWFLSLAKLMDKDRVMLLLKVAFVYNSTKRTYAGYLQQLHKAEEDERLGVKVNKDIINKKIVSAQNSMTRWHKRWLKARSRVTVFLITSSFVNIDILGTEFFEDEFKESLEGFDCNILSIIPKLSASEKFYTTLAANNFYNDGYLTEVIDKFQYGWQEDCSVLRYINTNIPLDGGMDAGNMLSMVFGQMQYQSKQYRILKEIFSLPPDNERQLANEFIRYFKPYRRKVLNLYYDRAMNSYKRVKADMATKIKNCIEYDENGLRTGWHVRLMSLGQGDIYSDVEYRFMSAMLGGQLKDKLFSLLIDQYNCSNLKAEMENCPTNVTKDKMGHDLIRKGKQGDKLPVNRLAKESTNLTDALKYIIMRRQWMNVWGSYSKRVIDPR